MWCTTANSTNSAAPTRNNVTRIGSSPVRAKGSRAAEVTTASTSAASTSTTDTSTVAQPESSTRCDGTPATTGNVVRSASCRPTTSRTAARKASTSSLPDSRNGSGMLYVADGPSSWSRNHNRCCAYDNGTTSGRARTVSGTRAAVPDTAVTSSATPATVGFPNNARIPSSTPTVDLILLISLVASSECPPRS